jgi:rare lipoprotein A
MKKYSLIIGLFLLFGLKGVKAEDDIILLENVHVEDSTFLIEEGIASYYGTRFHLQKTANGELYNMEGLTAAHKHLPFGTMLRVVNLKNEKEVWVRVNDRLPKSSKRVIDLSKGAAKELEMIRDGVVPVRLEVRDQDTIVLLIDYYRENKPSGLRLRLYPEPIGFFRPGIEMFDLMRPLTQDFIFLRMK